MLCWPKASKSKKLAIWGGITIFWGVIILVTFGIVFPIVIKNAVREGIPSSIALSKENEENWNELPGKYDIEVIKQIYLYNCTNREDVVMGGARPQFTELDPIPYLDGQKFQDINYTRVQVPWEKKQNERNAAIYKYLGYNPLYNGTKNFPVPEDYNKTLYAVNPTAFGIWSGIKNADPWRTQVGALYSVTVDGLGNSLISQIVYNLMVDENFGDAAAVKASLWPATPDVSVNVDKAKLMWSDKTYGLNNADNVAKWNALCTYDNDTRIEFQNEIFTYFGLAHVDLMEEATHNFCSIVDKTTKLLQASCPKMDSELCDASDFAYWQWASSYFTKLPALGLNKDSVTQLDDTILGYPEISFFRTAFIDKLKNSTYKNDFDKINFGSPKAAKNYGHLFYLPPADYVGDLPESSLFNLDTLIAVFEQIETVPDMFADPTVAVNYTDYNAFTQKLELDDDRQTYMLMIWLKNMLEVTAMRKSEGGTYLTTNWMGLAQGSLQGAHAWLSRDFPAYLYGNLMALSNREGCDKNIRNYIREVEDDQVEKFCNDTKLDLVSAESYSFYASIYLTRDYDKIQYIYDTTGLSEQAMQGMLTPGYYLERNLMAAMKKVKKSYMGTYCTRSVGGFCSNREIGIAQWIENGISNNPPKPLNKSENAIDLTGAHHYKPEIATYYNFVKAQVPNITYNETWDLVSSGQMYNGKFMGDVLLKQNSTGKLTEFNTPQFLKYIKYLTIEEGMGGLFIEKKVKDYIEGYEDKIIKLASMSTIEQGGDPSLIPIMSINNSPTSPVNSTDCFFVGDDVPSIARQYCLWLNNKNIVVPGTKYKGVRSWEPTYVSPWKEDVPLKGTDGGQFQPLMKPHETIYLFSTDVMMPLKFDYVKSTKIGGMTGWRYEPDQILLKNSTEEPDNEKYFIGIHGTLNLTSVYGAPIFATKGHYLDIGYNEPYTSIIVDKKGEQIESHHDSDEVYMVVEPWTGLTLSAALRLMLNFILEKDILFENLDRDYILPYTFVRKEYTMDKDQINSSLGPLKTALSVSLGLEITGYLVGILLIIGGGLLIFWAWRIKKSEGISEYSVTESYNPEDGPEKKQHLLNNTQHISNEETKEEASEE